MRIHCTYHNPSAARRKLLPMQRTPRRERGNIEPIELLIERPRPASMERRCCCTPRSLANAMRCFHCLARRGLQQLRRARSAPPTPGDEEGGVLSPLVLASPPRRNRQTSPRQRSPVSEAGTVSTCPTAANTPSAAFGGARRPSPAFGRPAAASPRARTPTVAFAAAASPQAYTETLASSKSSPVAAAEKTAAGGRSSPSGAKRSSPTGGKRSPSGSMSSPTGGAKISPVFQAGSVAARLAALQTTKPPLAPSRRRSAGVERLRARRAAPSCGRCGLDVHVADRVVHRDTAYHSSCLRCGACRRSVVDLAWSTLDGDDVPLCDDRGVTAGRRSCLVEARTQSLEHARADKDERPNAADVAGMREAKLHAVEVIGEELEALVLTSVAPTCALCGGRFAPSDRIVMQGMVKMHDTCMTTGVAPAHRADGLRLPPSRALKDAPATLVLKLALALDKVATFFIARVEQDDETCVAYGPDPAARAPPKRRVDVDALAGATVRTLSLQGVEVAPPAALDGAFVAPFRWTAQGLDWAFDVRFAVDAAKSVVAVAGATLRVAPSA